MTQRRVKCKSLTFWVGSDVWSWNEYQKVKRDLERRGAYFHTTHEGGSCRVYIPQHLPAEPFFQTLGEEDCIVCLGVVKDNVWRPNRNI